MTSSPLRILVVDDEASIRKVLKVSLGSQYTILEAANGEEALLAATTQNPDLVILDLGLPDMDGAQVTRLLRQWSQIPIIIVSVTDQEETKIAALDAGADDYLVKPFGFGELMARIRAALRHASPEKDEPVFELGQLKVDRALRQVSLAGEPILLTPTEYDILQTLIQYRGKVLTHQQLLRAVWGESYQNEIHLLRVNVSNLRAKIEADASHPQLILTEAGVGYRLKDS